MVRILSELDANLGKQFQNWQDVSVKTQVLAIFRSPQETLRTRFICLVSDVAV